MLNQILQLDSSNEYVYILSIIDMTQWGYIFAIRRVEMEIQEIKASSSLQQRLRVNGTSVERVRVAPYCRVSTDSEDQLNSYRSQVAYYTDLVNKTKEWYLVDIYADEAITGTKVTKREDFQRMINDCLIGEIDMIITKSISRFARNTLDTLKYVRMLKEKNIAVFFEDENINTLTMDGELLLVILSSVAQQEVENISSNVKKGIKMKMKRGEMVGFNGCLGYDYNKENKTITINEEEAKIVKLIFQRYIEGVGATGIIRELNSFGYKTKKGNEWSQSSVLGIIKNEKYKGDLLLGKTFTVDPIEKRRMYNLGEEDRFYVKDHHEPIVSAETFDKAQSILNKRSFSMKRGVGPGNREKYSRLYPFSSKLECGFCGGGLSRRIWHSNTKNQKTVWQCATATKKGKRYCSDSKGIAETVIECAFVESYKLITSNKKEILEEFINRIEKNLSSDQFEKKLLKIDNQIQDIISRQKKLLNLRIDDEIDTEIYNGKSSELKNEEQKLFDLRSECQKQINNEKELKDRLKTFKNVLEDNEIIDKFDRYVFESIVDKIIVGEIDDEGNKDPYKLTFVYKTGYHNKTNAQLKKEKNKAKSVCSNSSDDMVKMCSSSIDDTCGDGSFDVKSEHT